ncbi:ARM repeat-containing protein [Ceraceosorus guamensis]|uniref:ARM repeat-containing protein n=1 Tax=Ceraceosorus guamensis TaxID=1522189 RepID=A0A316W296_9BASI|nr:ARM repeat-containing protein [Ceraceosorus guamensis]PWN43872.1 ARM repeat-containing protein [Ceraceosorus guamensis]
MFDPTLGGAKLGAEDEVQLHSFESADQFFSVLSDFLSQNEKASRSVTGAKASGGEENLSRLVAIQARVKGGAEYLLALSIDLASEARDWSTGPGLGTFLEQYQEQSYLLDPYLDRIVTPTVHQFQSLVRRRYDADTFQDGLAEDVKRLDEVSKLLYIFTKIRGYKTIVRFFPHSVQDLHPALQFLEGETDISGDASKTLSQAEPPRTGASWELRYALLLWLSLVCMIPFDLQKFDQGATSNKNPSGGIEGASERAGIVSRLVDVSTAFISAPGKEREAAAVLLGKLFQRRDAASSHLPTYLSWCYATLLPPAQPSALLATGIMHSLCEIVKVSDASALGDDLGAIHSILDIYSPPAGGPTDVPQVLEDRNREGLLGNSLLTKYRTKLTSRLGLKLLKPKKRRRVQRAQPLPRTSNFEASRTAASNAIDQEEIEQDGDEVPEEVDGCIARILNSLQDKDTVVRYSAAKGLARICGRLPNSFSDQVADAIVDLFRINVVDILGEAEDLSNVSEYTWHGACLAIAELARRGLLNPEELDEKLLWVSKALLFDVRRGAHSVGTGVRDAACYVLWALARAHDANALRSHAISLAQRLVNVACLDRDVSIRRAASAAFQECVGRLNIFPHGIDVIRKTDFYAVSIRKHAFLACAHRVAVHDVYRQSLLTHLQDITLNHWDPNMRELGAQAVANIATVDFRNLAPPLVKGFCTRCSTGQATQLHGSLLTLSELCKASHELEQELEQSIKIEAFKALELVPRSVFRSMGANLVLFAACKLIASSANEVSLSSAAATEATEASWSVIVNAAIARSDTSVQIAAAEALSEASQFQDCTSRIKSTIERWRGIPAAEQQGQTRALGMYCFREFPEAFEETMHFLLSLLDEQSTSYSPVIETRQNACAALVQAIQNLASTFGNLCSPELGQEVFKALLRGLNDYTTDQRGDVGSWVRLACVAGLRTLVDLHRTSIEHLIAERSFEAWLPLQTFHDIVAGLLKQTVERIDSVRAEAGSHLLSMCRDASDDHRAKSRGMHTPEGMAIIDRHFPRDTTAELAQPSWLFPRATELLVIPRYRGELLHGLVLSLGSKTEMAYRDVASSLATFALSTTSHSDKIEVEGFEPYTPLQLLKDLHQLAVKNYAANQTFVPALQAISTLLAAGIYEARFGQAIGSHEAIPRSQDESLPSSARASEANEQLRKTLNLVQRNVDRIKARQRVVACMQLNVNLLRVPALRTQILDKMHLFLASEGIPTLRTSTAEMLFGVLQEVDISSTQDEDGTEAETMEQVEELLLETAWADEPIERCRAKTRQLVEHLKLTWHLQPQISATP